MTRACSVLQLSTSSLCSCLTSLSVPKMNASSCQLSAVGTRVKVQPVNSTGGRCQVMPFHPGMYYAVAGNQYRLTFVRLFCTDTACASCATNFEGKLDYCVPIGSGEASRRRQSTEGALADAPSDDSQRAVAAEPLPSSFIFSVGTRPCLGSGPLPASVSAAATAAVVDMRRGPPPAPPGQWQSQSVESFPETERSKRGSGKSSSPLVWLIDYGAQTDCQVSTTHIMSVVTLGWLNDSCHSYTTAEGATASSYVAASAGNSWQVRAGCDATCSTCSIKLDGYTSGTCSSNGKMLQSSVQLPQNCSTNVPYTKKSKDNSAAIGVGTTIAVIIGIVTVFFVVRYVRKKPYGRGYAQLGEEGGMRTDHDEL